MLRGRRGPLVLRWRLVLSQRIARGLGVLRMLRGRRGPLVLRWRLVLSQRIARGLGVLRMLRGRRGPLVLRWRLVLSQRVLRKLRPVRRPRAWLRQWFPHGPRFIRSPLVVRGRRLADRPRVQRRRLARS